MHDNDRHEELPSVRKLAARKLSGRDGQAPATTAATELDPLLQVGNRAFTRHVVGPGTAAPGPGPRADVRPTVQRSGARSQGAGPLDPGIEADIRSAQGGGRALDDHVRQDMESHLGADLSAVRIHADSRGDALSRSVQADAFTTGADVFFRAGRYAPESSEGRKLIAHELTHVVQQASGAVASESRVSHPDDPHEREASTVAEAVAARAPASAGGPAPGSDTSSVVAAQRQATDVELEEEPEEDEATPVVRQAAEVEEEEEELGERAR